MKKNLLILTLAGVAMNINAQMEVDSLGKVEINPYHTILSEPGYSVTVRPLGTGGILIKRKADDMARAEYGIKVQLLGFGLTTSGIQASNQGGMLYTCGVKGLSRSTIASSPSIGVFGGLESSSMSGVGVYGATTSEPSQLSLLSEGMYAGFFAGDVRVTGSIYGTVLSPASLLNSGEGDTSVLDGSEENCVTERLLNVGVLQTRRVNNNGSLAADKEIGTPQIPDIDRSSLTEEQLEELEAIEEEWEKEPKQTKLSTVSYGLAADQLKAVYPELVYEDANGNVSINYVEMVPLLVQSIKELSQKVAELEGKAPQKAKAQPTGIEDTASDIDMVRMDQNKPNPFSESTVIALNIPDKAQTASIFIYDMSGKQVQSLPVIERGETNITVYASDLTAGMYIYTLVVDGKVAVTRKMITSE